MTSPRSNSSSQIIFNLQVQMLDVAKKTKVALGNFQKELEQLKKPTDTSISLTTQEVLEKSIDSLKGQISVLNERNKKIVSDYQQIRSAMTLVHGKDQSDPKLQQVITKELSELGTANDSLLAIQHKLLEISMMHGNLPKNISVNDIQKLLTQIEEQVRTLYEANHDIKMELKAKTQQAMDKSDVDVLGKKDKPDTTPQNEHIDNTPKRRM